MNIAKPCLLDPNDDGAFDHLYMISPVGRILGDGFIGNNNKTYHSTYSATTFGQAAASNSSSFVLPVKLHNYSNRNNGPVRPKPLDPLSKQNTNLQHGARMYCPQPNSTNTSNAGRVSIVKKAFLPIQSALSQTPVTQYHQPPFAKSLTPEFVRVKQECLDKHDKENLHGDQQDIVDGSEESDLQAEDEDMPVPQEESEEDLVEHVEAGSEQGLNAFGQKTDECPLHEHDEIEVRSDHVDHQNLTDGMESNLTKQVNVPQEKIGKATSNHPIVVTLPKCNTCIADSSIINNNLVHVQNQNFELMHPVAGFEAWETDDDATCTRSRSRFKQDAGINLPEKEINPDMGLTGTPSIPSAQALPCGSETILENWIVRPLGKWICVEGLRKAPGNQRNEENWHSSSITQRLSAVKMATKSGSVYKLSGPINSDDCLFYGMSEEFVAKFQRGFPIDWKRIVLKELDNIRRQQKREENGLATKKKQDTQRISTNQNALPDRSDKGNNQTTRQTLTPSSAQKESPKRTNRGNGKSTNRNQMEKQPFSATAHETLPKKSKEEAGQTKKKKVPTATLR